MTKILMVCLGNICRSPLAEGILKSKLPEDSFKVESAGTGDYHIGERPDPRSIEIAGKFNIDISDQRVRQFGCSDFDEYDIIYAMDNSNFQNILELARNVEDISKVKLILEALQQPNISDVPDPYNCGKKEFENVFIMLNNVCESIAEKLMN